MNSESSSKALQILAFPEQRKSLPHLIDRFDQHLNIMRDKHRYITGKNCLDGYSIDLKIVDSFPDLTMNLYFHRYILEQLFQVVQGHEEFTPRDYQTRFTQSLLEADNILEACIAMMDRVESWIPSKYKANSPQLPK